MKSQGEDGCLQLLKVRGDDKGKIATTPELNRNKNAVKLMINIYYSKLYTVNLKYKVLGKNSSHIRFKSYFRHSLESNHIATQQKSTSKSDSSTPFLRKTEYLLLNKNTICSHNWTNKLNLFEIWQVCNIKKIPITQGFSHNISDEGFFPYIKNHLLYYKQIIIFCV